jgi:hypothetical protein
MKEISENYISSKKEETDPLLLVRIPFLVFLGPHRQCLLDCKTTHLLTLPVGQHVVVRLTRRNGETVQRAYNPVSLQNVQGAVDFLIKYVHEFSSGSLTSSSYLGSSSQRPNSLKAER